MNTFGRKAIFILEIWTWNNLAESWIVRLEHSNKEGWKYGLGRHCAINDRLYARIVIIARGDWTEWEGKQA